MSTDTHFEINSNIISAMSTHNSTQTKKRFTLLDGNLLCFIKRLKNNFYYSNKELAQFFLVDPSTIQRSIDRLVADQLIKKEKLYINSSPKRHLIYNTVVVEQFISSMNLVKAECEWDG